MAYVKAVQPIQLDANLYNDLMEFLDGVQSMKPVGQWSLFQRLGAVVEGDMCIDDDGEGECSVHNDRIEYWVDNFGPEGKVLTIGIYPPAVDTCFPVCPGAQAYRYDISVEPGVSANVPSA